MERNIHAGVSRMINITLWIFISTHVVGCIWHLIAIFDGVRDIYTNYWIVPEDSWMARHAIQNETSTTRYVASVYWSFTTLTTVGFGDITGRTVEEKLFSMAVMVLGISW